MTPKTLSVVIPAYNAAANIGETIAALADALELAPAFAPEVVLVDDGSTDGTADVAAEACNGRLPLRVIGQANHGRFLARRIGLDAATGEWVLLLDSRVTLHPNGLAFVAERLNAGEHVWNGHVYVQSEGNPIGAFWKAVAYVAWRDYLGDPITTSFGVVDFDRYPKGTGCFLAPRDLLIGSLEAFASRYPDMRFVSDDTAVIRWIATREAIHLSPGFACDYEARATLAAFFKQGIYRGTTFVDGHLRPESRFYAGAIAFFPISVLLTVAILRRPWLGPIAAVAGGAAGGVVAAAAGCSPFEVKSVAALTPVYAVAHGAGMWRGLGLLTRERLRRIWDA